MNESRCDVPCYYGGLSAARKFSKVELGHMWHCNRRVKVAGERCWQHRGDTVAAGGDDSE